MQSADLQPTQPIRPSNPQGAVTDAPIPATTGIDPAAVRRRRPRGANAPRSWRRRLAWWIPLGILMAVAVAGGGTAWRIRGAFQTVNSASTPAPSLTGGVLGGDDAVVIDTGPAKTAVAAGGRATRTAAAGVSGDAPTVIGGGEAAGPTATEVPGETTEDEPSALDVSATGTTDQGDVTTPLDMTGTGTATAEPASSTAVSDGGDVSTSLDMTETSLDVTGMATEAATATGAATGDGSATGEPSTPVGTPETVLSEVERIEDGGVEETPTTWYVEDGAGPVRMDDAPGGSSVMELPAEGAYAGQSVYFLPGTTYRLSGMVRLTAADDAGTLGVIFRGEDDARLTDDEPEPIRAEGTDFAEVTLDFTPPEGTTRVNVYLEKEAGPGALQADELSVRSIVPPAMVGASTAGPADDGTITLLFMGVDARPGEEIDINVRPDSLMVVHLNPEAKTCRVLSIPRDTRTEVEGYGLTKVNHALAVGGIDFQVQTVEAMLGIPIDHYVLIDFNGFEDLVDAVGGITIDVPEDFTTSGGTSFSAGPQTMDGKRALAYARDRSGPEGDFGRIERQQQIIRALVARSIGLDLLTSIGDLLPAVEQNVRTDLAVTDMVSLGSTYRSICSEEAITLLRLEGELATYDDPLIQAPLSYVIVDEAEIRRKVAALLEP